MWRALRFRNVDWHGQQLTREGCTAHGPHKRRIDQRCLLARRCLTRTRISFLTSQSRGLQHMLWCFQELRCAGQNRQRQKHTGASRKDGSHCKILRRRLSALHRVLGSVLRGGKEHAIGWRQRGFPRHQRSSKTRRWKQRGSHPASRCGNSSESTPYRPFDHRSTGHSPSRGRPSME